MVIDWVRGYRICDFRGHGPAAHVHAPIDGPARFVVDVESAQEAETLMDRYAARHAKFDEAKFREVMKQ